VLTYLFRLSFFIAFFVFFENKSLAAASSCSSEDFKESLIFLNDYLMCIAGSENDCTTISDAVTGKTVLAAGVTNFALSKYSADRLISLSNILLKDPKKYARDNFYSKRIEAEWGGKEVDDYLKKHSENFDSALNSIEKDLKKLEVNNPDPKVLTDKKNQLHEIKNKIEMRKSLVEENKQVIKSAINETKKINKAVLQKVNNVDKEISEIRTQLKNSGLNGNQKQVLKKSLAMLESKKDNLLTYFQGIDTKVKDVANIYNPELDKMISELKNISLNNPEQRKATEETIKAIEKRRIKINPKATGNIPRLILNVNANGYSVADANGAFKIMPKWAQENRLSAIRDFPKILKSVLTENPKILDTPNLLKEKLAYYEHERYRSYTQDKLINTYENRRRLIAITGEALPDLNLPLDKNKNALSGAKLNQLQRETLAKQIKANWLEVDVPLKQLSSRNIERTVEQVVKELELNVPFWSESKSASRFTKFFLPRPILGRALGTGLRVGSQWALSAAMLWFDYYDLRETVYGVAFQNEKVKNKFWNILETQCRMPKEQVLGSQSNTKEHSKWFCGCEEKEIKAEKLSKSCQIPPSEMNSDLKEYCQMAQSSGRDRDLAMAKKLSDDRFKNSNMKEIFQSAAGCEVMKNYPSHCRFTTSDVTDQGLYFMSIIRQNDLEKSVTELCPDVCQHWVDVANKKVNQIKALKDVKELPNNKAQNKATKECSPDFYLNKPPEEFEKSKDWRRCQPPIICSSSGNIRVNINNNKRDLEYYELKFNAETKIVNSVRHQHIHIQNKINNLGHTYLKSVTKPTFQYDFTQEGSLSKINIFDYEDVSQIKEVILPEEILSRFNEYAYNANSFFFSGRNMSEFAISKRIEILMMTEKAINYCCNNELTCGDDKEEENNSEPIFERTNKIK
jgi:hypothetical protein